MKNPREIMYIEPRRSFNVYDDDGNPYDMRDESCEINEAECFVVYANEWDNDREVWNKVEQETFGKFAEAVVYVKFTRKCNRVFML
ncbi:MAG: hypothetical protein WCH62_04120 [Candidatus Omnitrophota bacterium]